MRAKQASTPVVEPQTYNGQRFDAPLHMTRAWARVTLLLSAGALALGAGIVGALFVSPVALGAGAVVALPFMVFGGIMAFYTRRTHAMIYPAQPKAQAIRPTASAPQEEAGHVISIAGRTTVLPNLDVSPLSKPAPNLRGFPVCANDVLYILERSWREGTGFRTWTGHKLPSGAKLDRGAWITVLDGLLLWGFATARQTDTGRVVELRADVTVDEMMRAVQDGAK